MANKKPDYVSDMGEYKVEWRYRRDCIDADVLKDGDVVAELEYPSIFKRRPLELDELAKEAASIAEREAKS